jgi:hypothetical protein
MGGHVKTQDTDFEDVVIEAAEADSEGYTLTRKDGFSFFMPECGIIPKAGDTARFYGKGIGFPVRGLDINGQECFYRTKAEDEQKQKDDLYGKTALDMLSRWDEGRTVWSVEMGGLGPGYEQAIQILMMEIIRDNINDPLPDDKTWQVWGNTTVYRLDEKIGGYSGAQVGCAKQLAFQFLKFGPQYIFEDLEKQGKKDRQIQISKHFPSL